MINIGEPVYFFDDRNRYDYYFKLKTILFSDEDICLCVAQSNLEEIADEKLLFDINSGEVLNSDYYSWLGTNDSEWVIENFS